MLKSVLSALRPSDTPPCKGAPEGGGGKKAQNENEVVFQHRFFVHYGLTSILNTVRSLYKESTRPYRPCEAGPFKEREALRKGEDD